MFALSHVKGPKRQAFVSLVLEAVDKQLAVMSRTRRGFFYLKHGDEFRLLVDGGCYFALSEKENPGTFIPIKEPEAFLKEQKNKTVKKKMNELIKKCSNKKRKRSSSQLKWKKDLVDILLI